MIIRDFKQSDLQQYLTFSRDFYSGGATLHPVDEQNFQNTFAACCLESPYTRGLMLEDEDIPVGYCLLSFTWSNEVGGISVLLEEFYISPEHRGSKLGSKFMDWLFETYADAKRLRLEVCDSNKAAIRLYERMGFSFLPYGQMILDR